MKKKLLVVRNFQTIHASVRLMKPLEAFFAWKNAEKPNDIDIYSFKLGGLEPVYPEELTKIYDDYKNAPKAA